MTRTKDPWLTAHAKELYGQSSVAHKPEAKKWEDLSDFDQDSWYHKSFDALTRSKVAKEWEKGAFTLWDYDEVLEHQQRHHGGQKVAWVGGPTIHDHLDSYAEYRKKMDATLAKHWWQIWKPKTYDKSHEGYWDYLATVEAERKARQAAKLVEARKARQAEMAKHSKRLKKAEVSPITVEPAKKGEPKRPQRMVNEPKGTKPTG